MHFHSRRASLNYISINYRFNHLRVSVHPVEVYFTILQLNLIMTNYISLERSKTPKYILHHFFCKNKICRKINRLIYDKSAPEKS